MTASVARSNQSAINDGDRAVRVEFIYAALLWVVGAWPQNLYYFGKGSARGATVTSASSFVSWGATVPSDERASDEAA
jgi:hypothetical protein